MSLDWINCRLSRFGIVLASILLCFLLVAYLIEKIDIRFEVVTKAASKPMRCYPTPMVSYHQPTGNVEIQESGRTIMVHLIGGVGNQLWIYASLYGLAKKTNRKAIACIGYDMRAIFPRLSIPLYTYEQCKRFKAIHPNSTISIGQSANHLNYDVKMVDVLRKSPKKHAFICCYLQNLGFYVEYFDDLRADFVIKESLKAKAQNSLRELLKKSRKGTHYTTVNGSSLINGKRPVFVTVHIRRGNMLDEKNVRQPSLSYYKNSMDYFRKKYGESVVFMVASDDQKWVKANVTGNDVYYTGDTGSKSREDEFAIALACNHTIMSVGTFGWWMGFLTGGEVIYYGDWEKGDWKKWYKASDYFPYWWKSM